MLFRALKEGVDKGLADVHFKEYSDLLPGEKKDKKLALKYFAHYTSKIKHFRVYDKLPEKAPLKLKFLFSIMIAIKELKKKNEIQAIKVLAELFRITRNSLVSDENTRVDVIEAVHMAETSMSKNILVNVNLV
ncbi:hypothetical protein [Paraferrimonas sp. SM1919]|uniref:hypothetical protein n=1 Tax=Paraferrimonas sp. SM1919 TaxID=2662263 RepID=UPI0013D1DD10|nr:hypothetical protein [Paraferrimonas sp. SM1919]